MIRISLFGLGYVGCVTAACLAKAGHQVIGVDVNAEKVALINTGASPIVEPGLKEVLAEVVAQGRFRATCSGAEAVANTDLALICVGTPGRSNGQLGLDAIEHVGNEIGAALKGRDEPYTIVLRSTVLPGTTERVLVPAVHAGTGWKLRCDLHVASGLCTSSVHPCGMQRP